MVVAKGHPMGGQTDTLLALMGLLENEGEAGKAWIRNSSAPKKAVGRVTRELSTCESHDFFPWHNATTNMSPMKLPSPVEPYTKANL